MRRSRPLLAVPALSLLTACAAPQQRPIRAAAEPIPQCPAPQPEPGGTASQPGPSVGLEIAATPLTDATGRPACGNVVRKVARDDDKPAPAASAATQ